MENIGDIKKKLTSTPINQLETFIKEYETDTRKGVQTIVLGAVKKLENHLKEKERIWTISQFERECVESGYNYIGGVDEVGRGPLAGPVVAAVVILPKNCEILGVNDSKKLSEVKRNELYDIIINEALDYQIGIVSPEEIDEINILQATYKAMATAISNLKVKPDYLLVDAVTIPNVKTTQKAIIKGDEKSISIGAASIIAKVTRDRLMENYHNLYPEFDFKNNKGYGSQKHIEAIKEIGISPIHRKSFVKNFL